jgi:alpha-amylase
VVFQAFWWDCENEKFPNDWWTYLAKLCPRLRALGFDGIWIPSPSKGAAGPQSMGYDPYDHYDLGSKDQKQAIGTRFGTQDALLRLIAVAHANGLEVYPDIVLNHMGGGTEDPGAPPGLSDRSLLFQYPAFAGAGKGRWPKSWLDFHPNPDHAAAEDDWRKNLAGPDICYRGPCSNNGRGGQNSYMRRNAREWLVWLKKQTGADGFRFDAVKHFPPQVVEDLLFNAMGPGKEYFTVGEFVPEGGTVDARKGQIDAWAGQVQNRSGTFDFSFRSALASLTEGGGFFDMGSLPNYQQNNRFKTVPFVNSHDTWRGAFWDSAGNASLQHDDRLGDWRQNGDELGPTIDPDNPRADVAYAAAFAIDGSPMVFYEDLLVNFGPERKRTDPQAHPTRAYIENLVWCHRKLNFKGGAYKVRFQGSPDLLVIERSGHALIGLNDHGTSTLSADVQTNFGPNVRLHDYSGSMAQEVTTDGNGKVRVSVPPMSYCVWGRTGIAGGFAPASRRTTQEFQMDDDLGDNRAGTLGYGGRLAGDSDRTAGTVWVAAGTRVRVSVFLEGSTRAVEVRAHKPDAATGAKAADQGAHVVQGAAGPAVPLVLDFTAARGILSDHASLGGAAYRSGESVRQGRVPSARVVHEVLKA